MNSAEHPFRKWLGVDNRRPTWFEILGIPPEESDPVRIKVAAKAALNMLGDQPTDHELADWKMVRRQIREAYHGLIDETARKAYLSGLESAKRVNENDPPDESLPVAVPLAEVVAETQDSNPTAESTTADKPVEQVAIKTAAPARRTNGSAGRILIVVALVLIASGVGYGIWKSVNSPETEILPTQTAGPDANVTTENNSENKNRLDRNSSDHSDSENQPDRPASDLDDRSVEPPKTADGPSRAAAEPDQQAESEAPGESLSNEQLDTAAPPEIVRRTVVNTDWADPVPADLAHGLATAHHLGHAWINIQRRQFDLAQEHLDAVRNYEVTADDVSRWERLSIVARDYQEFENTAQQIARNLKSLEEIKIEEHRILVTTAAEDELVFRFGQRIALPYDRLPGLLALAIYERRHARDSVEYLMAKCLLYAIAAKRNDKYVNEAEALFAEAARLKLPVADYQKLVGDSYVFQATDDSPLDANLVNEEKRNLGKEYPRQVRKAEFSATQAIQLRDLALLTRDSARQLATVDWAIKNAEISGRPFLLGELVNLRERIAGSTGILQLRLSGCAALARGKLSGEQASHLVDYYLEMARECRMRSNSRGEEKFIDRAKQICDKFHLEKRSQELARRFNPDPTARTGQFTMD